MANDISRRNFLKCGGAAAVSVSALTMASEVTSRAAEKTLSGA